MGELENGSDVVKQADAIREARNALALSIESAVRKFAQTTGLVPEITVRTNGYRRIGSATLDPNRPVIVETRVKAEL
jgi:hypothetical protein